MKYLVLIALSLFAVNAFAAEERDIICHSGPGMFARYSQSRLHQHMVLQFQRQDVSHANKKVPPGYCAFPLAGMGNEWSNRFYFTRENPRDAVIIVQISPTTYQVDLDNTDNYGLYPKSTSNLDPKVKAMMEMMHQHRRYIIRAEHKKTNEFGWVWVVKSIGWNNTL